MRLLVNLRARADAVYGEYTPAALRESESPLTSRGVWFRGIWLHLPSLAKRYIVRDGVVLYADLSFLKPVAE